MFLSLLLLLFNFFVCEYAMKVEDGNTWEEERDWWEGRGG